MRKSKHGPGLFELLERDGDRGVKTPKVPDLSGQRGKPGETGMTTPVSRRTVSTAAEDPERTARERQANAPFVELDGGRIQVSLTSLSTAVIVFALLVVVFGAFETGRRLGEGAGFRRGHVAGRTSYEADAMSEIEAARSQPPATHVVDTLWRETAGSGATSEAAAGRPADDSEASKWIRDYTYIVVQEFSAGHEDDARHAQAFLAQHGVATEVVGYPSGAVQLITAQGYNHKDSAQRRMAESLQEKVHALGAQYFAAGGGYRLEGYFKSLKGDTW